MYLQILSQGGQRQLCVDELTSPMLLNVCQLSEAILPSVSFNSNGLALKVSACYKEEGKYPHLMDKGMWITSGKMWHGVFTRCQLQKDKPSKQKLNASVGNFYVQCIYFNSILSIPNLLIQVANCRYNERANIFAKSITSCVFFIKTAFLSNLLKQDRNCSIQPHFLTGSIARSNKTRFQTAAAVHVQYFSLVFF